MMKVALYIGTRRGWHGVFNRLIRWFTCSPYSHVELVFSDGMSASSSGEDGGVRFKRIEFDPKNWDFIDLDPIQYSETDARAWFESRKGQEYDYRGLVRCVIPPIFNKEFNNERWFCSEAVMASLGYLEAWRFKPCDVYAVLIRAATKRP